VLWRTDEIKALDGKLARVAENTKKAAKSGIMVESQFLDLKEELL
jgi:hypothetical protein